MNGNFMSDNPPCDFLCLNPTKGSQIHANYSYMYEKAHQLPAVRLSWVMYVKGEGMIISLLHFKTIETVLKIKMWFWLAKIWWSGYQDFIFILISCELMDFLGTIFMSLHGKWQPECYLWHSSPTFWFVLICKGHISKKKRDSIICCILAVYAMYCIAICLCLKNEYNLSEQWSLKKTQSVNFH